MTSGAGEVPRPQPQASTLAYPALLVLGALDAAGYSVLTPVLPTIAAATHSGPAVIGLLVVASFPLAMLTGFALAGIAVRHARTSAVLLAALTLLALGCVGFIVGHTLPAYLAARVVMGLGAGGLWIAVTFAILERGPGQEYVCLSRILAAYAAGGLLGPALGALGGIRGPFVAYLGLVVAAAPLTAPLRHGPSAPAAPARRAFQPGRTALGLAGFWLAATGEPARRARPGPDRGGPAAALRPPARPAPDRRAVCRRRRPGRHQRRHRRQPAAPLGAGRRGHAAGRGITLAGAATTIPGFIVGLALAGAGVGAGQTGAIGILLAAVAPARIVTAMVVWSQFGIVGYLAGPALGGTVAQAWGFRALGGIPLAAAAAVGVTFLKASRRPGSSPQQPRHPA
jgi:MFS family permease